MKWMLLLLSLIVMAAAQQKAKLILNDGREIDCYVLEETESEVVYQLTATSEDIPLRINKSQVANIIYASGGANQDAAPPAETTTRSTTRTTTPRRTTRTVPIRRYSYSDIDHTVITLGLAKNKLGSDVEFEKDAETNFSFQMNFFSGDYDEFFFTIWQTDWLYYNFADDFVDIETVAFGISYGFGMNLQILEEPDLFYLKWTFGYGIGLQSTTNDLIINNSSEDVELSFFYSNFGLGTWIMMDDDFGFSIEASAGSFTGLGVGLVF